MVPCEVLDTVSVVTVKVPVVAPAATVTLAGTKAGSPLVHKSTVRPPVGAGALRVTVPVADEPPVTLAGFTETEETVNVAAGGAMVSVAVLLIPL